MDKKNKIKTIVFGVLAIFFMIPSLCAWLFVLDGYIVVPLVVEFVSLFIFISSFFLCQIYSKGYKFKYYFLGKRFKSKVRTSLEKYGDMPEWFTKHFISTHKETYQKTGELFEKQNYNWIYQNIRSRDIILETYEKLLHSINTKGGFVEFINSIENMTESDAEGYYGSNYEICLFMCNDLISNEFRYLINEVYSVTNFRLFDNKIYADFTNQNNEIIKRLNEVYSPALFEFKSELENALDIVKNAKQQDEKSKTNAQIEEK